MRGRGIRLLCLASGLAALATTGCAEERAPINRVQANALAKSFFVGEDLASSADNPEFYMRGTVVDVGYGDSNGLFTSANAQRVSRVKWEITERILLARLAYERIDGADGHGVARSNNGIVVAAFAVTSHFDIRRAYNPTTGEQQNVIEENASDRPWYERQYMRVDWSQNLVTDNYDFDSLSLMGLNGGVDFQSVAYNVSDPSDENAPVFDPETGYFDVTNHVYASPKVLDTPYGMYPACYFRGEVDGGTFPVGSCDATEITVRLSWRKVVDTDYEPKDWTGQRFSMFGAFYEERRGYDQEYGVVDAKWHRFGAFWNIWQKSHVDVPCYTPETTEIGADPHRDGDMEKGVAPNGTEDECEEGGPGSRCDVFTHKCTLPYSKRENRKIPWYFGPDQDPELFQWTSDATAEWDMALRKAVQTGRLVECRRTNGASIGVPDKGACDAAFPTDDANVKAKVPSILFLCHNPVAAGDSPDCGPEGLKARLGDLRYNFVNAIGIPQTGSPWGVMLDGVDPLTGEKVQASINIWDSVTNSAAQGAVDVIRWMNGEITDEEIKSGAYLNQYAISGDLKSKDMHDFRTMSEGEVNARIASLSPPPAGVGPATGDVPALTPKQIEAMGAAAFEKNYGAPIDNGPLVNARYNAALGSPIEAQLTNANFMQLSGLDSTAAIDKGSFDLASPLRANNFQHAAELQRMRENALAQHGYCMVSAPEPTAFVGLAKIMKTKFPIDAEADAAAIYTRIVKMRNYLRKRLHYGVILHEMGHSIGLRHNFVGSYDSFNFRPQYWQLRTKNGTVTKECTAQVKDGSTCVGPRWFDPMTEEENDGLLWMWQHTTVMDYPGDVSQDSLGLGPYDKAAARFFYTDTIDLWNTPGQECVKQDGNGVCFNVENKKTKPATAVIRKVGDFGGIGGPWTFVGPSTADSLHYSKFNETFELLRNCRPTSVTQPASWDEANDGKWDPVFDGHVVLGTDCDSPPVDYTSYADLDPTDTRKELGSSRIRWPHMFATDYSVDIGNVAVLRHDNGADMFEQFNFLTNMYENRHIFDNFRRGRQSWSVRAAAMRTQSRFNDKMRNISQAFALYHDYYLRALTVETKTNYVGAFEQANGMMKPNALAAAMAFDHLSRSITRPQPGSHKLTKNPAGDQVFLNLDSFVSGQMSGLVLPEGSQGYSNGDFGFGARKVNNSLNNADGSFDIQWLTSAGSYYDKVYAIHQLTESSNRFLDVSLNDFVDGRYRNLSFVNLYPDGFRRLVATSLTGDTALLGPRVGSLNGSVPEIDSNQWPKRPLGWTSWWPAAGPESCWPTGGSMTCVDPTGIIDFDNAVPPFSIPVDGQVGFEVQKFVVFWSLLYLPENWKSDWIDHFRIYTVGGDAAPDLPTENAIYFRDPESGMLYIAHRKGTETIFSKTVEKGIAARMLSWANTLTLAAYEVTGIDPVTGKIDVVYVDGEPALKPVNNAPVTKCEDSPACIQLRNYKALLDFTRQTAATFGFPAPEPKGLDFN